MTLNRLMALEKSVRRRSFGTNGEKIARREA
jgi:hypothetical protein